MSKIIRSWEPFECSPESLTEVKEANGGKIILKGILQKADTLNQNGRIYPKHILEREVKNYQKFIVEKRAMGECVPPGTQIFTRDGWKNIENIADDEFIYTLNVEKNEIQIQRINKKIVLPFDGELFRFKNASSYDMCLTPNHRVLMWDRSGKPVTMSAKELNDAYEKRDSRVSHSGLRRSGAMWVGESPKQFEFPDGTCVDTSLWAAFLGIYIAEGHSSGVYATHRQSLNDVVLTQNEGATADSIRLLLKQLPWKFKEISSDKNRIDFVIKNESLHSHLLKLGGSRSKFVPNYAKTWNTDLQQILLDWMLLGDGRHRMGKKTMIIEYCTSSAQLANDVSEIMFKLGHGASIHTYEPKDKHAPDYETTNRMILAENQTPMNIVYQHSSMGMSLDFRFMQIEKIPFTGDVFCVNVNNGTWLMKYNDKICWTHNCDHPDSSVVSLKNVSHVIREAYFEGNTVFGVVEVLPKTPSGAILAGLIESGVKLGISSRGVGSTVRQGDYYVVQDDFQLICWDFVSEPSTPNAFMLAEGVSVDDSDLRKVFNKSDRINRIVNDFLNLHNGEKNDTK